MAQDPDRAVEAWFREAEEAESRRGGRGRALGAETLEGIGLSVWGLALAATLVTLAIIGASSVGTLEARGLLPVYAASVALACAGAWIAFRLASDVGLSESTEWSPDSPP